MRCEVATTVGGVRADVLRADCMGWSFQGAVECSGYAHGATQASSPNRRDVIKGWTGQCWSFCGTIVAAGNFPIGRVRADRWLPPPSDHTKIPVGPQGWSHRCGISDHQGPHSFCGPQARQRKAVCKRRFLGAVWPQRCERAGTLIFHRDWLVRRSSGPRRL